MVAAIATAKVYTFYTEQYYTFMHNGEEREKTLRVEYQYEPPSQGSRDDYGAPLEPDHGDEVLIVSCLYRAGDVWDHLSPIEKSHLLSECWEDWESRFE